MQPSANSGSNAVCLTGSPERPRTELVNFVSRPDFVFGAPERKLLRPPNRLQPSAAEHQEPSRARRDDAELTQIRQPANHGRPSLVHDTARGSRTDARHAQQLLERR